MRILIAEDEPVFRQILQKILVEWGYQVVVAGDGTEAYQILSSPDAPKLAILDWKMPGMEGVDICRKLREQAPVRYTYLILLTSQQRDEDLITGMEAGADDYIIKPFKHNELRVRLRAGGRILELHDELAAAREILQERATHDALTGLYNREEILTVLDRELARLDRDGVCFSIIMADIDHFKQINDSYGHLTGDAVLRETARKMHSMMRPYDSIGRYGGEEFLVVLPECCGECAGAFAERLCSSISRDRIDTPEGMIPVTISLGVASSGSEGEGGGQALLKAADAALYQAKEDGRNRVAVAPDLMRGGGAPRQHPSAGARPAEPEKTSLVHLAPKPEAESVQDLAALRRRLAIFDIAAVESEHLRAEILALREYSANLLETVREPLVMLNSELRVLTANQGFYDSFGLRQEETIGSLIYDLGHRVWDLPELRMLLEEILPRDAVCRDYRVGFDVPGIGRKDVLLNARQIYRKDLGTHVVLLALEEIHACHPRVS